MDARVALALWCSDAGLEPRPRTISALARGVGVTQSHTWRLVFGQRRPSLALGYRIARELRIPLESVAVACERARERYLAAQRVEAARLLAQLED